MYLSFGDLFSLSIIILSVSIITKIKGVGEVDSLVKFCAWTLEKEVTIYARDKRKKGIINVNNRKIKNNFGNYSNLP